MADERPWRSERARSLRSNPSASIASVTLAAVAGATPASALITRETVFRLTPAWYATSLIVGLDNVVTGAADASARRGTMSSGARASGRRVPSAAWEGESVCAW